MSPAAPRSVGATDDTLERLRAGQLAGTQRLALRCGLRELPREVFALADTLEVLDLSGNALESLPDDLPRLHRLRVVFASDNAFTELPEVLGRCASLEMVGFKANRIERVSPAALPPALRWLILTDNRLAALPEAIGRCARLQKLMLAGNRLRRLPTALFGCERLELLRIAANHFERVEDALPAALLAMPRLAWLAHAGNPFADAHEAEAVRAHAVPEIDWSALHLRGVLGEGASGHIHDALWQRGRAPPLAVAVKLFKGAVTSDGLPRSEMAACIAAGTHPNLVGVEGRLVGHPEGLQGLVLRIVPSRFGNLAGPPSLASCTRDVYAEGQRFTATQAVGIARGVASALAQLHARGLVHGDLYAHNVLVDDAGHSLLGDFGAASFVPPDGGPRAEALRRLDRRALGWLVDELAQRCDAPEALDACRDGSREHVPRGDDAS